MNRSKIPVERVRPRRRRIINVFAACWSYRKLRLALVLLVSAGLLIKSFWNLQAVSPGFDSTNILTAGLSLSFTDYPNGDPRRKVIYQQALERLARLPGVESVGAISHLPLGGRTMQMYFRIEGRGTTSARNEMIADYRVVTPAHF
ncbi:MAG: hypothetical protein WKF84_09115 [Pyrinomonadaceae bacterium]